MTAIEKEVEFQIHQLDRKNVLIDLRNDHQNREFQMLKTLMSKIINKESSNNNEVPTAADHQDIHNELVMQKRPSRLLPLHLFKYIFTTHIFAKLHVQYLYKTLNYLERKKRNQ